MKVTFPHLGPLHIALRQMFIYLEVPYVIPPINSSTALSIGCSISPEEICMPFKYMAGNLMEAYRMGADTAVMISTNGPCRLGEYGELLKTTLEKAGCDYDWVLIDPVKSVGATELIRRLKMITRERKPGAVKSIEAIGMTVALIRKMDLLRSEFQEKAGYAEEPYLAAELYKETKERLAEAGTFAECFSIIKQAKRKLAGFAYKKDADPVKILIAGEIYTSIEPEASGRLEESLMSMGCSVRRHIDIWWWIKHTTISSLVPERIMRLTLPKDGIRNNVGGYGRETSARIIKDKWCDGIIKIMPAGCMPEIVTKAYCENLKEEMDLRILDLIFDEMTGQTGYETRVEAFIDMLERRKDVLAGDRHRFHKYRSGFDG